MVMVLVPSTRRYYPLTHEQWNLLALFDGERSYEEIAELYTSQTSVLYTEQYVREYRPVYGGYCRSGIRPRRNRTSACGRS